MAFSSSTVSFSEGPLFRQLLSFALPLMAVNILQYVYQAVDMAVVGQVVGDVGLVSMSNAVNAVFLVNAFVIGLSAGGGVVVARAVGAGDVGAQRRAYAATLLVALLASAGIAAAGTLLARPAFTANAVPAAALDGAVAYTTVLCCGAVGPFLMNAAAAFLKAQGDAWTPLLLVGAATFVNVALDLVLVGPAGLGVRARRWPPWRRRGSRRCSRSRWCGGASRRGACLGATFSRAASLPTCARCFRSACPPPCRWRW